jgi:hypothetical protein
VQREVVLHEQRRRDTVTRTQLHGALETLQGAMIDTAPPRDAVQQQRLAVKHAPHPEVARRRRLTRGRGR